MSRPTVALLLLSLLAAGCVSTEAPGAETASTGAGAEAAALPADFVMATGAGAIGFLDSYVMTHPFRVIPPGGGPRDTMVSARDDLVAEHEAMGLRVERHEYSGAGTHILAYQDGTEMPEEWIVLSAHYDTTESTVYGAWDDGAGTAKLMELAKSGATRTFRHTIVYAFFDEEEQGLVGSRNFVEEYQEKATLVANLNFDPPGLNWPCADAQGPLPVKIIFNPEKVEGDMPGYQRLYDAVIAGLDAAEVPEDVRDFDTGIPIATLNGVGLSGGSDHMSFDAIDVPNVFIGSAPTSRAGPVAALSYGLHTPVDTKQQMVARCGSEDLMTQAFDVEIRVVLHALDLLDTS